MAMKNAPVERYVEQVRDGTHYKGYVKIADITFDYELTFTIPIARMGKLETINDEDTLRRLVWIVVKRGDENIELTREEYCFFFSMIVKFAICFHNKPETRDFPAILRDEGLSDVICTIGMTFFGVRDFTSEQCEMLRSSKFGCALPV